MTMPPPSGPYAAEMLGPNWPMSSETALVALADQYRAAAATATGASADARGGRATWTANAEGVRFNLISDAINQYANRILALSDNLVKCGTTCNTMSAVVVGAKNAITATVVAGQAQIAQIEAACAASQAASPETGPAAVAAAKAQIAATVAAAAAEVASIAGSAAGSMPKPTLIPIPPLPAIPGAPGVSGPPGNAGVGRPTLPGGPGVLPTSSGLGNPGLPASSAEGVPKGSPNVGNAPAPTQGGTPGTPGTPSTPGTPDPGMSGAGQSGVDGAKAPVGEGTGAGNAGDGLKAPGGPGTSGENGLGGGTGVGTSDSSNNSGQRGLLGAMPWMNEQQRAPSSPQGPGGAWNAPAQPGSPGVGQGAGGGGHNENLGRMPVQQGTGAGATTPPAASAAPAGAGPAPQQVQASAAPAGAAAAGAAAAGEGGAQNTVQQNTARSVAAATFTTGGVTRSETTTEAEDRHLGLAETVVAGLRAASPTKPGLEWAAIVVEEPVGDPRVLATSNEGCGWIPQLVRFPEDVASAWADTAAEPVWALLSDPARVLAERAHRDGWSVLAIASSTDIPGPIRGAFPSALFADSVGADDALDCSWTAPQTRDRVDTLLPADMIDKIASIDPVEVAAEMLGIAYAAHNSLGWSSPTTLPGTQRTALAVREQILDAMNAEREMGAAAVREELWRHLAELDTLNRAYALTLGVAATGSSVGELVDDPTSMLRFVDAEARVNELVLLMRGRPTGLRLRSMYFAYDQILRTFPAAAAVG